MGVTWGRENAEKITVPLFVYRGGVIRPQTYRSQTTWRHTLPELTIPAQIVNDSMITLFSRSRPPRFVA